MNRMHQVNGSTDRGQSLISTISFKGPICITVPNFIKIGRTVAEIWQFNCFPNGGRLPSWILNSNFLTVRTVKRPILRHRAKFTAGSESDIYDCLVCTFVCVSYTNKIVMVFICNACWAFTPSVDMSPKNHHCRHLPAIPTLTQTRE